MDNKELTKRVYNFTRNKKNNAYAIRLVSELYNQLSETAAENYVLQKENEILNHQLDIAEKYSLG